MRKDPSKPAFEIVEGIDNTPAPIIVFIMLMTEELRVAPFSEIGRGSGSAVGEGLISIVLSPASRSFGFCSFSTFTVSISGLRGTTD